MEFLEYHGILKGLFQTLKVRELLFFCPSHGISGIFVCQLHCLCVLCVERAQTAATLTRASPELSFSQSLSCA